jgi:hypothetical protein
MRTPKLTPEKELESLKEEIKKIDDTRAGIRDRIHALEDQVWEPMLKKKYVGKYFKYNNSYGGTDKTWMVYYKVTGVDGVELLVNEFQHDPYELCKFQIQSSVTENLLQKKITKREWDRELKKFLGNIKKLK